MARGANWWGEFGLGVLVGERSGGAHAALDFGLKITAQVFGDDAGRGEFAKIRYGKVGQKGEHGRQGRRGIAYKREAHIVSLRPFAMTGDGLHDAKGGFLARQGLEHLGFREEGIIKGDGQDIWVAFRDKCAGNVRGASARESNLLAQGQLGEARDDLGFGEAFEFHGGSRREGELDEIHEVDIAQQAHCDEPRGPRMKEQSPLDGIAFKEIFARADVFEQLRGKILARE